MTALDETSTFSDVAISDLEEGLKALGGSNDQQSSDSNSNSNSDVPDAYEHESDCVGDKKYIKGSGVINIELYRQQYHRPLYKIMLFSSIFLVAYAYGMDSLVRFTFQYQATSKYKDKTTLRTVNCIKTVMGTAGQFGFARCSDVFGRTTVLNFSIMLYTVGTIIQCKATTISKFSAGTILYQLGLIGIQIILEIIAIDFSDLNWRLVASFIPALPFVVNIWISGFITQAVGDRWQWGIGMFAFIVPIACIPLACCLLHMRYLAYKNCPDQVKNEFRMYRVLTFREYVVDIFFWRLDFVGFILLCAVFGCILIPLVLAGGAQLQWRKAHIIIPEVVGWVIAVPAFLIWEVKGAKHPLLTWDFISDRGILAALIIAFYINFIYHLVGDYMFTVLMIALDQSVLASTRITSLYSFVCVICGTILGFVIIKARRTKPFIIFGICCWFLALGLMLHYFDKDHSMQGITASLCLMGLGAGFFTYTTQASVQAAIKSHAKMAVVTALYLSIYSIGSAVGSAVSGALWTNLLPREIFRTMNHSDASPAYDMPQLFILNNAWGTPPRMALIKSYTYVQKILCLVALCFCVPLLAAALFLRNHKLQSTVALENVDPRQVKEDERRHDLICKIQDRRRAKKEAEGKGK